MAPTAVLRGGSWNNNESNCRPASRNRNQRNNRNNNNGFRLARTAQNHGQYTKHFARDWDYGSARLR
ncbi:MAG: SUMF1/EgtB/PvdO family nonheme iron enzyme [Saprospiraceae bacterium]|nr:SUMF1/EgtB/PvdO family nonheme iron enzyme [Saprospiraceae bacterium]